MQKDSVSSPTSPKRQKTFHAADGQKTDVPVPGTADSVTPGNSEKTKVDPGPIIISSDSSESVDMPGKSTSKGPSLVAAPHTRYQVSSRSRGSKAPLNVNRLLERPLQSADRKSARHLPTPPYEALNSR